MTTADSANPAVSAVVPTRVAPSWMGWLLPPATILVIVVTAVLLLITPLWMHTALEASGATGAFSPCGPSFVFEVSDSTVKELLLGPATFREGTCHILTGPLGRAFLYTYEEAAHLRDARVVFYLFLGLAGASLVFLAFAARRSRRDVRFWQALRRGGAALVVGTVVLGVIGFFAFDIGFELFHRIFFPGGNWAFPPDSNLIRLYPYAFWQLTSLALGVLCVIGGSVAWLIGRRRAAQLEGRA